MFDAVAQASMSGRQATLQYGRRSADLARTKGSTQHASSHRSSYVLHEPTHLDILVCVHPSSVDPPGVLLGTCAAKVRWVDATMPRTRWSTLSPVFRAGRFPEVGTRRSDSTRELLITRADQKVRYSIT